MELIDKSALVAEIERRISLFKKEKKIEKWSAEASRMNVVSLGARIAMLEEILSFLYTLEVKDPYELCVQYDSIKAGIQAHAETYSFNIESELFNQLTKEQQKLWRKEIEQACISGGDAGYTLAKDPRYKENLKVKEVDVDLGDPNGDKGVNFIVDTKTLEVKEVDVHCISENIATAHEYLSYTHTSNLAHNKPMISARLKKAMEELYKIGLFKLTHDEEYRMESIGLKAKGE